MAKRNLPFPFGNLEHVANVADELHEALPTVRLYEKLFGFVIERERRHPLAATPGTVLKKRRRRSPEPNLAAAKPASRSVPGRVATLDARALQEKGAEKGALRTPAAATASPNASSPRRARRTPSAPRKRKVKQ